MKLQKTLSRILDGLLLLVFILFFSSAGFQDRNTSGWYQQWFPNLNGSSITSITFLDSLTGFAISNTNSSIESYILRTNNGGDNWNIIFTYFPPSINSGLTKIKFATDSIGYAATNYLEFYKTTNKGENWLYISTPPPPVEDMSVVNKDTIFIVSSSGLAGGVYRSTNGGVNWSPLGQVGGNGQPSRIYMFDKNLGFTMSSSYMRRTTNGGFNWTIIPSESFTEIQFVDSQTGWRTFNGIKKSTDGGVTWLEQQVPPMHYTDYKGISILNKDTIWVSGPVQIINSKLLGAILKTTNGGINWGYQFVDTSVGYSGFRYIHFIDKKYGWAFPYFTGGSVYDKEMHTTVGGNDTTYITGINNNISVTPGDYKLCQNYPNPFNTRTVVRYQLSVDSKVSIKLYDVQGREIQTLVEKRLNTGVHEYTFNGNNLSSGIYFYTLYVNDNLIETKKMTLLK